MPNGLPATRSDLLGVFLSETPDDEGNARCALAMFGGEFCYSENAGWMRYTGTHWTRSEASAAVDRMILTVLKLRRQAAVSADREAIVKAAVGTARRVRDCKALFQSLASVSVDSFDADPELLNVANGVVNLRTKTITPHAPEQRFTYCIPTPYSPDASTVAWETFLAESVHGGLAMLAYLQMAFGYSLTGLTWEECLWYLFGPSRSGKGIFTETLLALLGQPLATEIDFATFTARRDGDTQNFDLAPLRPARFVVTSESNKHEVLNAGKIKQLTGGNYVRCAFKGRDLFTYRPQFKPWLVSNQPVNADVDDAALWHRVKVIEFPNSHIGTEDKTLKERMRSPENLQGVLKWAIDGAAAWFASPNGLEHPAAVLRATYDQRADLDMVGAWIEERCTQDPNTWASHADLFQSYEQWCRSNGVPPKTQKGFSQALKAKSFALELKRQGTAVLRIVLGLSLQ